MPGRPHRRPLLALLTGLLTAALVAGCAVGPSTGPEIVDGDGLGAQPSQSSQAPQELPQLTPPAQDLAWADCADDLAGTYGIRAPEGVIVECAEYTAELDQDSPGLSMTVAATRISVAATPDDGAPLVLTSGSDLPSSRTLMLMAEGPGRALLDSHPIVGVERRGLPQNREVDCMTRAERDAMAKNGLAPTTDTRELRLARLAQAARSAADGCNETLTPGQLNFGIGDAAADIETLRQQWGVERLGLIGVGEGSDVAIAYASQFAGRVGRMILDTPTPYGADAGARAQSQATGVQSALTQFVAACGAEEGCVLGGNGSQVIGELLDKGAADQLDGISDTQVLAAITTAIALAPNNELNAIATAIVDANNGDTAPLAEFIATATELRLTDGHIVARCNDVSGPIGQNEIPALADRLAEENPLTGADAAVSLLRCTGWASAPPVAAPDAFPIDPLVLNNAGDTINGANGIGGLTEVLRRAGGRAMTVSWQGLGYSTLARNACAADTVRDYVTDGPLPGPDERTCTG